MPFLHKMQSSFMINSFWAVEHLISSVLVFKYKNFNDLKNNFIPHDIVKYWDKVKEKFPKETIENANNFNNYISEVKGYYDERYPKVKNAIKAKIVRTGGNSQVFKHVGGKKKNIIKFDKSYILNLDGLDYFVSFMLHDVLGYDSHNFGKKLLWNDNADLYLIDNKYSITYPNRKYPANK